VRFLIIAAVILFLVLWVRALLDLTRRADLSGGAKFGWGALMLLLPFVGLLLYVMFRPSNAELARRS
jgi:Phospholipase_D-nuclease N-terminal